VEALRLKYGSERFPTPLIYESGQKAGDSPASSAGIQDRAIRISGKEVEEVGFEKIRQRLADLQELKIVLLDGFRITRQLSAFRGRAWVKGELGSGTDVRDVCPKVTELDLSRNLFEEWREIAQICLQLEYQRSLRVEQVHSITNSLHHSATN
jgi:tubulin-specific chaperone E